MTVNLEHESLTIGVTDVVTSYDQSIASVSMHRSSFVVVPQAGTRSSIRQRVRSAAGGAQGTRS